MTASAGKLFLALVAMALCLHWEPSEAPASAGTWCGVDQATDWVCPLQGAVFAKRRMLYPGVIAPLRNRRLATGRRGAARLSFRDQANCTLYASSLIFPRVGRPDALFTQKRGSAACVSSRPGSVRILCSPVEPCPTEMRARGEFLFKTLRRRAARASRVTTRRHRIEIVSCDGFIDVRVRTRGGFSRASGGGSPGSRQEIVIDVISRVVRTAFGVSIARYGTVRSSGEAGTPAAEECEASFSQQVEDTATS